MKFLKYFSIHKSKLFGKRSGFYWKPTVVTHKMSVGKFNYEGQFEYLNLSGEKMVSDNYNVQHGLMIQCIQVFWLWFIFAVTTEHETQGYGKDYYARSGRIIKPRE